jgi:pyruvate/2-oxoglutarate dehydrogenase complex dihydrolipoamide acyltransferase (E2) component
VAKKTDKSVKDLAKKVKKLRKENERLAEELEKIREDQAESRREILALLEERLPAPDEPREESVEGEPRDAEVAGVDEGDLSEEDAGGSTETLVAASVMPSPEVEDRAPDAVGEESPEVTDAAKRRALELGVDPSGVRGTGSGGRVLVKDVEAAAKR